ncbi:alpha/beta-hydrolase [Dentipellis sp. KUC8613]|nr:alpha/beta-hydrolase [Dentipellis sp. KUC8613]
MLALFASIFLPSHAWLANVNIDIPAHDQHPLTFASSCATATERDHDVAGRPNTATRLELTSRTDATLFCAADGDTFKSGYAHFANYLGVEDKHMFWWLFEAREEPESKPTVLLFGGGPGSSGLFFAFSGAGPCRLIAGEDGEGAAIPSEYPWTDYVNVLAIDHPVGVGYSYGDAGSLRNSSDRAAWDVDDFLQAFWAEFPQLAKNQFMIQSASYGGTYIPHIVNTILTRDIEAQKSSNTSRLLKMPESVIIGNGWSDPATRYRYYLQIGCLDLKLFNQSTCASFIPLVPVCLDALQLADEQPTLANKRAALHACWRTLDFNLAVGKNPFDARQECDDDDSCFPYFAWNNKVVGSDAVKEAAGIPEWLNYTFLAKDLIGTPFARNGDHIQAAYKLLGPAIEAGLRVLIYNGNMDAICPWRANLAWMRIFQTKHQEQFRAAPRVPYPGVGWYQKAGAGGAGEYTFLSVDEAGHFVQWNQPRVFREFLVKWMRNEAFSDEDVQ